MPGPRRIIVGSLGWPAALEITIAEIVAGHRLQSMPLRNSMGPIYPRRERRFYVILHARADEFLATIRADN